MAIVAQW